MDLVGRHQECRALDDVLAALSAGRSGVLVLRGGAGIGKTALLDEAARRAAELTVVRVAGVESELEFTFAALHQLCTALSGHLDGVPAPQREALLTAFGERAGLAPDSFLVGLGVLSLLSEAAQQRPVLVLVDDQHWLDRASGRVIGFVARRLAAEPVGVILATRHDGDELRGLPALVVSGLGDDDSRALLAGHLGGPVDAGMRDQIIAEARGNPLALLEWSRALSASQLAGGFGAPDAAPSHSLEGTFRRQLDTLPLPTRRLLALAAADPAGDTSRLWRAAETLGLDSAAAMPAIEAGLAEIGSRVLFRHPLIRSAAYRCVPLSDRRAIHGALAAATDAGRDPERRAWHLGHAAVGPDDAVADELQRCAELAQARGGVAAAAAFLERASALTPHPARRCTLALTAAAAKAQAGILDAARDLVRVAESGPMTELQRARADLVHAQLALISSHGNRAAPLMLAAAGRLEPIDAAAARETYLDAMTAALFAGRLAEPGGSVIDVSHAVRAAVPAPDPAGPADLLLTGLATQYSVGFDVGLPAVRRALRRYGDGMSVEQELRWMFLACFAAARVWDIDRLNALGIRYVELVTGTGAVTQLPLALSSRVAPLLFTGHFDAAARAVDEMCTAITAMGNGLTPFSAIVLAAMRGRNTELDGWDEVLGDAERRGEGFGLTAFSWSKALAANGSGDYATALDAAAYASAVRDDAAAAWWSLPELIEAATRTGDPARATDALHRLTATTTPSGTRWALGVEARCRALVSTDAAAEAHYLAAIEHLTAAGTPPDLARARLLYGEWLRRQRRRVDARGQLRTAHAHFAEMGMAAFEERARRELLATGEKARPRTAAASVTALTAQEAQIAGLARDGLSNPEIGARLFISARTVQYHLGKVFTKLGIKSRGQLDQALVAR